MKAVGKLGDAIVYSHNKGRAYAKKLTRPKQPRSASQMSKRACLRWLALIWISIGTTPRASWNDMADAGRMSPHNAFLKFNLLRFARFRSPTLVYPPPETAAPDNAPVISPTVNVRSIRITINPDGTHPNWGYALFHSLASPVVPSNRNLIAGVTAVGTANVNWLHTPLKPDTYYYMARGFTLDGSWTPDSNEISALIS